jgi:hypothetical protein
MKKIITFTLTLMLIAAMAVPAYAVTPGYKIPEVPQISQIKPKFDLGADFWERYWETHPIKVPEFDWSGVSFKFFN